MTITLNDYANGDTNYVAKFNQDNNTLETAINGILTALGTMGVSEGPFLNAIFGTSTAFIGSSSYAQSTASTTLTISAGYAWRPDLGTVLYKGSSTAINYSGQPAATYYIEIGADGTPSSVSSSSFPMYSVVWTGSAFGTITQIAPIVPNGDVGGNLQTLTIDPKAVTLAKMADLAANSIIGNNAGSPATPLALTVSQVVAMLSAEVTSNKGVANGYASLDSGGKVPTAQLPSAIAGAMSFQGTWNANTNSPTLTSGTGTPGYFYIVSTGGTTTLDGLSQWNAGDIAVFENSVWNKIDGNPTEVLSVAGLTGAITGAALIAALSLAAIATSGSASDLITGTVPVARLPIMVGSGASHAAGAVPDPGSSAGTTRYLREDGTWATVAGASGGTVTSVGLTMPSDFSVGGSPITGSGTLAVTAANQSANTVKAGPTSGAATAPTYRALVAADIPALRFDIAFGFVGIPANSQLFAPYVAARAITIASANASNCQASSSANATGSATFTLKKNGSSVGTCAFSGGSATGTWTISSDITLAAGDRLTLTGPATADATLADLAFTLYGTA